MMSAFIPSEQRQAVLRDSKLLEGGDKSKCLGSMFTANGQGTAEIRNKIDLARATLSRLKSYP